MFIQLLGKFLVEQNVIDFAVCSQLQQEMMGTRVRMGTIAVAEGMMSEVQAEEVNHIQTQQDRRFGDIAVEKGYLTEQQISVILGKQGNDYMKFVQLLVDKASLTMAQVDAQVAAFKKSQGFTDAELEALKADDFEAIIPLFACTGKRGIIDLAALVMRNLTRFVSRDFYFGRMRKEKDFSYTMLAGQKIEGDVTAYLGFATTGELDGIMELAKGYAKDVKLGSSEDVYDAVCEFANLNNGLYASAVSTDEIFADMNPPMVYLRQQMSGTVYVLPIYIAGKEIQLIIGDEAQLVPGTKAHIIEIAKADISVAADGKKSVLVVDDSALIRKVLRNMLESNGYAVVAEGVNGSEAVALYEQVKPDFVTLDITMPVKDGVEALAEIMQKDANAKVVMITAAGQQKRLVEAIRLGAKCYITKPLNEEELLKNLQEM